MVDVITLLKSQLQKASSRRLGNIKSIQKGNAFIMSNRTPSLDTVQWMAALEDGQANGEG